MCKNTKNRPFCDGSHKNIETEQVGKPLQSLQSSAVDSSPEEPHVANIQELVKNGLKNLGDHGEMGAMGVPAKDLPKRDDIQFLPGQMAKKPLLDEALVG